MKKRVSIIMIFVLSLNMFLNLIAAASLPVGFDETLSVGQLIKSTDTVWFGTQAYPIYKLYGEPFISFDDLKNIGAVLEENDTGGYFIRRAQCEVADYKTRDEDFEETTAYLSEKKLYIGNVRSYSIQTPKGWFIPFRALKALWYIEEDEGYYTIRPRTYEYEQYIAIDESGLTNLSDFTLTVSYTQIYWKEDSYIEKNYKEQMIGPHESIQTDTLAVAQEEQMIYLTTFIQEICGLPLPYAEEDYGQKPTVIYEAYTKAKRLRALDKVFPKYKVTAKVKYPAAGFQEGEEVELWRSEKGQYHVLKRADGKKIVVPLDSIDIVSDMGKGWQPATTMEIEDYVNLKGYESDTEYLIWTDIYRQLTYVFKGEKNNWNLVKSMKCSTGKNKSLTPTGEFKIEYKVPYFGVDKGYRCKNALVVFRDYMYHSILFDITGKYVRSGQYQLGARVSHGCIRLSEEDSKWLYTNIPEYTKVYIE